MHGDAKENSAAGTMYFLISLIGHELVYKSFLVRASLYTRLNELYTNSVTRSKFHFR
jgi:hypothetical protein